MEEHPRITGTSVLDDATQSRLKFRSRLRKEAVWNRVVEPDETHCYPQKDGS